MDWLYRSGPLGFEPFALTPSTGSDGLGLNGYWDFHRADFISLRQLLRPHHVGLGIDGGGQGLGLLAIRRT